MEVQKMLDTLVANLPLLIALAGTFGLLGFIAGHIRRGVVEARKAAKATPSKLDDALVDLVDGPLLQLADMVERGDYKPALVLAKQVHGTVKAAQIEKLKK